MRVSDDINLTEGFFCGDLPNGGCNLECSMCKGVTEDNTKPEESAFCAHCGRELFYRSWWEW